MELNLSGKTAIVTGGGSNIGRAIALAFGAEGAKTAIADIDEAQGGKVAEEIKSQGGTALFSRTDVTNYTSVESTVATALKEFGQIDILVNSVGWVMDRLFVEKPRAEWEKEVNLNLWSYINCTRAVVEHMMERKVGKIVNISSDAGRMGEYREVVYSACKGGVLAMTRALAKELGRYSINVNAVCPGVIVPEKAEASKYSMWTEGMSDLFTPEIKERVIKAYPLRRLGKASEIANAVIFLSSSAADYITGQTLSVSGGYTTI
ncbi:SDR family NAD(P)-dependent oxidoreductase [Chloroflexota bacterium]